MDSPPSPARIEQDGFELVLAEQHDASIPLPAPLPSDEARSLAKPGDHVKLVFRYREPKAAANGVVLPTERMWVEITEQREDLLVGKLESSPRFTDLLKRGDVVSFHWKHVIAF